MTVDLSGLKDIHVPTEPSLWPLAVGWQVLIGAVLTIGVLAFLYRYTRPKQYALRELKAIALKSDSPIVFVRQMSLLLKRIALIIYPRKVVASLSEETWARFLVKKTNGLFSEKQAKLLAFSTYLPDNTVNEHDAEELYKVGRVAICQLFKGKKDADTNKKSHGSHSTSFW